MKKLLLLLTCVIGLATAKAQQPYRFWNDIQNFKVQDSISFPAPNQILFIGSSSFRMWHNVNEYFPKHKIINRGFGGSQLLDLIQYRYEVIYPYQPKQIVIYCGENDFAATDVAVDTVVKRFKTLFYLIRAKYPTVPLAYVSMKPSPSRKKYMENYNLTNIKIEAFLKKQRNTVYIDVYNKMLKPDGNPMEDIFLKDNLHMNEKGYKIWQKTITPYLKK